MTTMGEEEASLLLLDRQLSELSDRITALRTVIGKLQQQGDSTSNQYRLLADMCSSHEALHKFRIEALANWHNRH